MSKSQQYAKSFTDALQFMWGEGFLSPGGPEEVSRMLEGIDIRNLDVLDLGCGLGGVDLLLVQEHGARRVVGVDVESDLLDAARELIGRRGLSSRIEFRLVDPGPLPVPAGAFDVVFSKDAMVHIPEKQALYADVLRVLRPGGWFIAADWLWSAGASESPVVRDWLSRGPLQFVFTTPLEAETELQTAGFHEVVVRDESERLQISNRDEVRTLEGPARDRLAQLVGREMADRRLASARGRQASLDSGDLIPSHLRARRPENPPR